MAKKKSELIKLYAFIGLLAVLLVTGYVRFSGKSGTAQSPQNPPAFPRVDLQPAAVSATGHAPRMADLQQAARDIFAPGQIAERAEAAPGEKPPVQASGLVAKGTITGGGRPVAVINESFVREGDMIGEYRVVKIRKSEVVLKSNSEQLVLEVLDNAEK